MNKKETIILHQIFNTTPSELYNAWLDSKAHSQMTGGEAICSTIIGENFSTWDDYITGKNISLIPYKEIIQSWRTTEFEEIDEDSLLKIRLQEVGNGTELTIHHSNIPTGQLQYISGWKEHYFEPMTTYFNKKAN